MINIGTLDKRITFLSYGEHENDYGLTELSEQELITVWARIEPLRGREYYEAQHIRTVTTYKITTRYFKNLDETMKIRYQDRVFEIQNIIDPYMNHSVLEFICIEKQRGEGIST